MSDTNHWYHTFLPLALLVTTVSHSSLFGLIIDVRVWHKTLDDGAQQTIYLLGDVHKTTDDTSPFLRKYLLS